MTATNEEDSGNGEWYVSGAHTRRAVGYLSAAMPELHQVEAGRLLDSWGEALLLTIETGDLSPIGADQVQGR
jgi:hypothetical protein